MRSRAEVLELLDIAKARLRAYLEEECKILKTSQSYTVGSTQIARASLKDIREQIETLKDEIKELENELMGLGARKTYRVLIRDL